MMTMKVAENNLKCILMQIKLNTIKLSKIEGDKMNYYKKEIELNKFVRYCYISFKGKSKRIRKKAGKIVDGQVDKFYW